MTQTAETIPHHMLIPPQQATEIVEAVAIAGGYDKLFALASQFTPEDVAAICDDSAAQLCVGEVPLLLMRSRGLLSQQGLLVTNRCVYGNGHSVALAGVGPMCARPLKIYEFGVTGAGRVLEINGLRFYKASDSARFAAHVVSAMAQWTQRLALGHEPQPLDARAGGSTPPPFEAVKTGSVYLPESPQYFIAKELCDGYGAQAAAKAGAAAGLSNAQAMNLVEQMAAIQSVQSNSGAFMLIGIGLAIKAISMWIIIVTAGRSEASLLILLGLGVFLLLYGCKRYTPPIKTKQLLARWQLTRYLGQGAEFF